MPRASKDYNLRTENPELAKEWHPTKNGNLKPEDVPPGTKRKVWWICSKKNHEWEAPVGNRNNGTRCPECSGRKTGLDNNLEVLFPDVAREWDYKKIPKSLQNIDPDPVRRLGGFAIKNTVGALLYQRG